MDLQSKSVSDIFEGWLGTQPICELHVETHS